MSVAREGDLVLLISQERKRYLIRLKAGESWYSHRGGIPHSDLIGQPLGRTVYTPSGHPYLALEPSTGDLMQDMPRSSQIVYGKDAAQILFRLNLYPGRTVVECGTGSGALTLALGRAVMTAGHVYSYETRPEAFTVAQDNLRDAGCCPMSRSTTRTSAGASMRRRLTRASSISASRGSSSITPGTC